MDWTVWPQYAMISVIVVGIVINAADWMDNKTYANSAHVIHYVVLAWLLYMGGFFA